MVQQTKTGIKISVITPVYNAEKHLKTAVESAVDLEEVFEIILVEDGSPDNCFRVCEELQNQYPDKVKLFTHPDRENKGAGAARNLGIAKASGNYIAFLDADDVYLPNRFKNTVEMLENDPYIDGTHAILGIFFENEEAEKKLGKLFTKTTGLTEDIEPSRLLDAVLKGGKGHFHLNTLTVKKSLAEEVGGFDEKLKISQDGHFIWKLAACGKIKGEPRDIIVAKRRAHEDNRVINLKNFYAYHIMLIPRYVEWAEKNSRDIKKYYPDLALRHLSFLKGFCREHSNKNVWMFKFLFVRELVKLPVKFKVLFCKYAFKNCVSVLLAKSFYFCTTYDEFLCYFKKNNLQKKIDELARKYRGKKVLVYGAGIIFDVVSDNFDLSLLNISHVSDVKFQSAGIYKGYKTVPCREIPDIKPDLVLFTLQNPKPAMNSFEKEIFPRYRRFKCVFIGNL